LGSLNEFRKYFDLEPHKTFADITKDKYVQEQLKHLYDHPDKVEIYPGIVVEDAKEPMAPGSGLCPGFTVSRAVLADAVALVRGDRFYTKDYNPSTLTNWGYNLVDTDTDVDNGCVFYKLFLRAFPNHFKQNSVYAHYPLTVSSFMQDALKDLKKDKLYDFTKPKLSSKPHIISEYKLATQVMKDQSAFKPADGTALEVILGPSAKDLKLIELPTNPDFEKEIRSFYSSQTRELLASKSAKIADFNQVDIVRNIGNLVPLHFCAELFMLPLKTPTRLNGIFTEAELYLIMSSLSTLLFFDVDSTSSLPMHTKARKETQLLGSIISDNIDTISKSNSGILHSITKSIWPEDSVLKKHGIATIQQLLESKPSSDHPAWPEILATASATVSTQSTIFAQTLEYYIIGAGKSHWPAIQALAQDNSDNAFDKLTHYVMEGGRLNSEPGLVRTVAEDTSLASSPLKTGDTVFVNLRAASHDPAVFPNPLTVDLTRPLDSYIHLIHGGHGARIALTAMMKEVAKLKGLRPAQGPQGKIHKVVKNMDEEEFKYHQYLTEMQDVYFSVPCGKFKSAYMAQKQLVLIFRQL
jgi:hypothetical protein